MSESPKENHRNQNDRMDYPAMPSIKKSDDTIIKEALKRFELIGEIMEDGIHRGFKREEIMQLITTGVIKV